MSLIKSQLFCGGDVRTDMLNCFCKYFFFVIIKVKLRHELNYSSSVYAQILGHPNAARYAIDWDGNATYNLVINPTLLVDGGAYRCIDVNDASNPQYAQVVTIGNNVSGDSARRLPLAY
jgi:hypothetical protein